MSGFDIQQARQHIKALRGDSESPVQWQFFNDGSTKSRGYTFSDNLSGALASIKKYQQQGYGAYITINPTDSEGSGNANIVSMDYAFADFDNLTLPESWPAQPSLITGRDATHSHVYWPLKGCLTQREYNYLQKKIALYFGSDEQVIDPSRICRLAGTAQLKDPANPRFYKVVQDNSDHVEQIDYEDLLNLFELPEEKQEKLDTWFENAKAKTTGAGFNDDPKYRDDLRQFASVIAEPAVKGTGRSYALIRVAGYGYDRGVRLEETQEILWEHYNPRCEPPWTEAEKENFYQYIKHGYEYYNNAPGSETTEGKFKALEPVSEPVGGWEENKKLGKKKAKKEETPAIPFEPVMLPQVPPPPPGEGAQPAPTKIELGYVTREQLAELSVEVTNKSTTFDQALLFLGLDFPNGGLIRSESVFYSYNGLCWDPVSDDYIKSLINLTFSNWKLSSSKVKAIFDSVVLHTHKENLMPGTWLDTGERTDAIIMNNCIIIMEEDGKVRFVEHTRNLFDLNYLDYDYQPTAKCDLFLKFLNDQWPDDSEMHHQVQELYGMMFIDNSRFQKLPILVGRSRSGKGVHTTIIRKMIGEHNVCGPTVEAMLKDPIVDTMSRSKLAIIPEANNIHHSQKGQVIDRLKAISGGDPIEFDRKWKGSATCQRWPLLLISTNKMPELVDSSGALANRAWPFPFTRSFEKNPDTTLVDKLTQPEMIAGIFNWALEGAARMIRENTITTSQQSIEFQQELKRDSFPLADFVEDYCIVDDNHTADPKKLYDSYVVYSRASNNKAIMTYNRFVNELTSSYLPIIKKRLRIEGTEKRKVLIVGLSINPEAEATYKPSFTPVAVGDK